MTRWLERTFDLTARGTSVRTALIAGVTTFLTRAYIMTATLAGRGRSLRWPLVATAATLLVYLVALRSV